MLIIKVKDNMLQSHLYEKHKVFLDACKSGDTAIVKDYLEENAGSVYKDRVAYEGACIATQNDKVKVYEQLIKFHPPCIHAAQSVVNSETLADDNECLKLSDSEVKKYNRSKSISNAFENFKIMGQIALGVTALATFEVVKMGSSLISDKIKTLRENTFPSITATNTNKL